MVWPHHCPECKQIHRPKAAPAGTCASCLPQLPVPPECFRQKGPGQSLSTGQLTTRGQGLLYPLTLPALQMEPPAFHRARLSTLYLGPESCITGVIQACHSRTVVQGSLSDLGAALGTHPQGLHTGSLSPLSEGAQQHCLAQDLRRL